MNRLLALQEYGQSVWLDFIKRSLIHSGDLKRLIDQDGLRGMTSNPAIFEKAIADSPDYADDLARLSGRPELDAMGLYEALAIRDIQDAADVLRPVWERTKQRDGYISLEVSPYLARDTQATITEARRLWKAVGRENIMIKVPGSPEGLPAIEQLLSEGLNINITLLFAQPVYEQVAETYVRALERFVAGGGDPRKIGSVASFFVSRIDTLIDGMAADRLKTAKTPAERAGLEAITGKIAIANAKLTYQRYKEIFSGPRWKALADKGAQTQRVLWASTSTKNPNYRDVIYVEELIGHDTVNTMPPQTVDAFRDHGVARAALEENVDQAARDMKTLEEVGISMKQVTDKLLDDGIKLFADAFDKLLAAVEKARGGRRAAVS